MRTNLQTCMQEQKKFSGLVQYGVSLAAHGTAIAVPIIALDTVRTSQPSCSCVALNCTMSFSVNQKHHSPIVHLLFLVTIVDGVQSCQCHTLTKLTLACLAITLQGVAITTTAMEPIWDADTFVLTTVISKAAEIDH